MKLSLIESPSLCCLSSSLSASDSTWLIIFWPTVWKDACRLMTVQSSSWLLSPHFLIWEIPSSLMFEEVASSWLLDQEELMLSFPHFDGNRWFHFINGCLHRFDPRGLIASRNNIRLCGLLPQSLFPSGLKYPWKEREMKSSIQQVVQLRHDPCLRKDSPNLLQRFQNG